MENANEIISITEGLLKRYNSFYTNATKEEYFENKTNFQIIFYITINKLVNVLNSKNYNIYTEKQNLKNSLKKVSKIYFDSYQLNAFFDESWQILIKPEENNSGKSIYPKIDFINYFSKPLENEVKIKFIDYGFRFFEPKELSEKIINEIFKNEFSDNLEITHSVDYIFKTKEEKEKYKQLPELSEVEQKEMDSILDIYYNQKIDSEASNESLAVIRKFDKIRSETRFIVAIEFAKLNGIYAKDEKNISKAELTKRIPKFKSDYKKFAYYVRGTFKGYKKEDGNQSHNIYYNLKNDKDFNIAFFKDVKKENLDFHEEFKMKLKEYNIKNLSLEN